MKFLKTHVQIIKDDHEMVFFVMMKEKPQQIKQKGVYCFYIQMWFERRLRSLRLSVCPFLSPFGGSISLGPLVQTSWQLQACILISPAGRAVFSVNSQTNWNSKVASPWF